MTATSSFFPLSRNPVLFINENQLNILSSQALGDGYSWARCHVRSRPQTRGDNRGRTGRIGSCKDVCLPSRSRSSLTFLLNLEINPEIQLTILESESKLGGVWNEDRCFPGFLADSPTGLFDFSDLPMRDVIELKDWADLPGYK
jgi:hypothetical protein